MDNQFHEVDADGDTVLVLRNPNAPFAVCDEGSLFYLPKFPKPAFVWDGPPAEGSAEAAPAAEDAANDQGDDGDSDGASRDNTPPEPSATEAEDAGAEAPTTDEPPAVLEVKLRVSSKHLTMASRYFKIVLEGPWRNATKDLRDGRYHVFADNWDSAAVTNLMLMIHGRNRRVPKEVDLEMLAKFALLVDYYQCHESVEMFSDKYIDQLKGNLPNKPGRELVLWLLVSSVFGRNEIFERVKKVAIYKSGGPVPTLGLPLDKIIDEIESRRLEALREISSAVRALKRSLCAGKEGCSLHCASVLLGSLMIQMDHLPGWDKRSPAYLGYSVSNTVSLVEGLKNPTPKPDEKPCCTLQDKLESTISRFRKEVQEVEDAA